MTKEIRFVIVAVFFSVIIFGYFMPREKNLKACFFAKGYSSGTSVIRYLDGIATSTGSLITNGDIEACKKVGEEI